jgi:hypothetical protein
MFIDFMFHLRGRGFKVGLTEWLTLMEALKKGHVDTSLDHFYRLCRAICARSEADFDLFDQCFLEYFADAAVSQEIKDDVWEWLKSQPDMPRSLTEEEKAQLKAMSLDETRRQFEERLAEQTERHDGGNRWVGTGGTSPFGHSGYHPAGIRVGGESQHNRAIQIAGKRQFRAFRKDITLDTRQLGLALKKLREWQPEGARDELDLDATIDATGRNAGDIELIFRRPRKNAAKLLLLMDIGGSMTYHSHICERLFAAVSKINHFKEFRPLYFHNCPYESLYLDEEFTKALPTADALQKFDSSWYCFIIGDAAMSPYELTEVGGAIDYDHHNEEPGLAWLQRLRAHFRRMVWLNPEPRPYWEIPSNQLIRRVIPNMFPLTIAGLEEAISTLKQLER